MNTIKPGRKTTEFLIVATVLVAELAAAVHGSLPPKWAAVAAGIEATGYALSRALVKAASPKPAK